VCVPVLLCSSPHLAPQWISSLRPRVFAMVGFDLSANALPFLTRFKNSLEHFYALLDGSHAACAPRTRRTCTCVRKPSWGGACST